MLAPIKRGRLKVCLFGSTLLAAIGVGVGYTVMSRAPSPTVAAQPPARLENLVYQPHLALDTTGYFLTIEAVEPWKADASLDEIAACWRGAGSRVIAAIDKELARRAQDKEGTAALTLMKAGIYHYDGNPAAAARLLEKTRADVATSNKIAAKLLFTVIYFQGVTALRQGENDNCILCRGESSCILPIAGAAVHTRPRGSRDAIRYFTEYLAQFPDDIEVKWLLNLAHMTLGEHPGKVNPKYLLSLDRFVNSEFDIGRFRDIGHLVGVNRLNMGGGSIMDDFDNDGRLDLIVTTVDPNGPMAYYHNKGDGTFEDRTESAGLSGQLGGLTCYQADYNNDGRMDVFIPRGAWVNLPMRPTLLRNDGGTFTDVTVAAKVSAAVNSNAACWADYDNDGFIDLFVACEKQPNRLYHNRGDGTFEEVASQAGVPGKGGLYTKGATWTDFDNDGAPDLFLNNLHASAQLFHNEGNGTFIEVTTPMKIDGPVGGFSCWTWDYDNDGWLDIFATSFEHTLRDVVAGILGQPYVQNVGRLYRNVQGKEFEDVTDQAGLNQVFSSMGSNFGDVDNDGFLDFYLGTGDPSIAMLVPNRMFKNVDGRRFAEISGTSRTGHLQKGHGIAFGDWDRDGDVDVFIGMGGAVPGDKYHNILFQNPGQGNHWLTVKLVGEKTNRAAVGARIKVIAGGAKPRTIHRQISSGSSFGANPMQQTIGLARADRIETLEIFWPTSKTTQVFHDVAVNQSIEIVEFSKSFRRLDSTPIPLPAG